MLNVNPAKLHASASDVSAAARKHAKAMSDHHADYSKSAARWTGSASSQALQQAQAALQARHAAHREQVGKISSGVSDSAQDFAAADQ